MMIGQKGDFSDEGIFVRNQVHEVLFLRIKGTGILGIFFHGSDISPSQPGKGFPGGFHYSPAS